VTLTETIQVFVKGKCGSDWYSQWAFTTFNF